MGVGRRSGVQRPLVAIGLSLFTGGARVALAGPASIALGVTMPATRDRIAWTPVFTLAFVFDFKRAEEPARSAPRPEPRLEEPPPPPPRPPEDEVVVPPPPPLP